MLINVLRLKGFSKLTMQNVRCTGAEDEVPIGTRIAKSFFLNKLLPGSKIFVLSLFGLHALGR